MLKAKINEQFKLRFIKTLPLKLHYGDIIVVSSWYYFLLK